MACKLCGANNTQQIYFGPLRNGKYGRVTSRPYPVYQCMQCGVIWHDQITENTSFYETSGYRDSLDETDSLDVYHSCHDNEVLRKIECTGTECFRSKVVADVGAGGGSFLDWVRGSASKTLVIEPSQNYRAQLSKNNYETFGYVKDALKKYAKSVDVVTSFDVIEHVEDPIQFAREIRELIAPGGIAMVGTPTDYPVLRQLIGEAFNNFIFSVQHPWIFSEKALTYIFTQAGFDQVKVLHKQLYGIGNLLAWAIHQKPMGDVHYPFISDTLNEVYKQEMIAKKQGEYLMVYARP